MRPKSTLIAVLLACGLAALAQRTNTLSDQWVAPTRAAARKNPIPPNETSIALGKRTYERHCLTCHGAKGKGDGPTAGKLDKRPGDLSNPKLWAQSDGALLWKLTEGHRPMPTFKDLTTDEERWPVINYIRTLSPGPSPKPKQKHQP